MNLSGQTILVILIVGGIAGWLAGLVTRGSGFGIIGDIIVGFIGSFIGSWLLRVFHVAINLGNPLIDVGVVAFIGAVVLLAIIGMLRPPTWGSRWGRY
jgi:uncharacterized membrane protein YeaQ/YmgE (transglycosylase-associated protein family)